VEDEVGNGQSSVRKAGDKTLEMEGWKGEMRA